MSGGVQRSMFFLGLPDLKKLVCVPVSLQEEEELRSKQMKTCRELVLLYSDLLASPALDSFTDITVVMAIPFFQRGILQVFSRRHSLQLGCPQRVLPGVLQACLSYSLITRLAPSWNKAGLYLIAGKDFLNESSRLSAVSVELNASEGRLDISVEANTVRLPPARLEDFDLSPLVLRRFCSDPDSILDPTSTGGAIWCHVLPSMKKGQIITISRQLPRDGPFRTYRDLQTHWNRLYGYRLPDLAEEEVVYCSVYFRLVGERLFTYPLSCIRLQPVQRCPRVDLHGVLGCFLSDISDRLQSVCGFPARLAGKPSHHPVSLSTAAVEEDNLISSSSSSLPFFHSAPSLTSSSSSSSSLPLSYPASSLTSSSSSSSSSSLPLFQPASSLTSSSSSSLPLFHPAPPITSSSSSLPLFQPASSLTSSSSSSSLPLFQPASSLTSSSSSLPLFHPSPSLTSSSSSASSSSLPLSYPASSLTSSSSSFSSSSSSLPLFQPASSLTSSSSSSSLPLFHPAPPITSSSSSSSSLPLFHPAPPITSSSSSSSLPLFHPAPPIISSSSSSLPLFQSASSLTSSSLLQPTLSLTSSSSSVLPPLPPPTPKLVPIFKNKRPSRHVNVALLRAQKEQLIGGGEERGRVTLPASRRTTPTTASSSTVSSLTPLTNPPPLIVPRFNHRPKAPQLTGHPRLKHISTLSPTSKSTPGLLLHHQTQPKDKSSSKNKLKSSSKAAAANSTGKEQERAPKHPSAAPHEPPPPPPPSSDVSNRAGVVLESKKKSRSAIRDVDVEQMARSNQLSRLNSSTLLSWLRGRGVHVGAKHRKEDLMLKVMGCLAEA